MSEQGTGFDNPNDSVETAASAIEKLLNPQPAEPAQTETEPQPEPEPEQRRGKNPLQIEAEADASAQPDPEPEPDITPANEPSTQARDPKEDQRAADISKTLAEAEAARNQHIQATTDLIAHLKYSLQGEFGDVKTDADLLRIAEQDPLRYNRYVIHQGQLQRAEADRAKVMGEQRQMESQRFNAWQRGEVEKLPTLIPELKDPAKAPALVARIRAFAKDRGYTDEQLQRASAADFATINDAMNFRDMKAAQVQAAKKAANAPPVQRPGAVREAKGKDENLRSDFNRLRKSGSVDDAANVLKSIFG